MAASAGHAVSTQSWSTSTYAEFDKGDADDALITSDGEVLPGFSKTRVNLETDAIWSAVRAADGTVYAGAVSDGKIFALKKGGKPTVLTTLGKDSPWVGALVLDRDTLYAGTLGTANVYAINLKTGKATQLVHLAKAEHVWALELDAARKTLYAATGPEGQLFAIDVAKKQARVAWDSKEKHLFALTRAKDGALWIGTTDEAILYRYDPKSQKARAIADFAGTEVKAIVEVDGGFVVAANEFDRKAASVPGPPKKDDKEGEKIKTAKAGTAPGADAELVLPERKGGKKATGGLFRVELSGRIEQLHALTKGYFTSLAVDDKGHVFAGAGAKGRVYEVTKDRAVLTAFDVPERQVNAVLAYPGGLAFATGDAGALYTSAGRAQKASYTSDVFDAKGPSRWGKVRWRASGDVQMESRSGNTSKPELGWSAWAKVTPGDTVGGHARGGAVTSPPGRYFQYRVSWSAKASAAEARLREVTLYYLPQNQRARIKEISISGSNSGDGWITTQDGPVKPRSPVLKLKWTLDKPDGDELVFTLDYRAEGDVEWRRLPTGRDPLKATSFNWNTEALPDGYYTLRVRGTDASVNPDNLALSHEQISRTFLIDNQKPRVEAVTVRAGFVSGRASDSFSHIKELAYSIDDDDWNVVFPKDGIFDDLTEMFTFKIPTDLSAGKHVLSIRAADEADNIGATSVTFRGK